ncbi:hypothetical protein ARMSODRAFT_1023766 [Armillaria solidipes]|uniref:Uncharacterized protein n=1 Tax=Armillaria solidipes TaxID=1076256 RepID=A0A2H3BG67_9AGAR|nr:hypothetical protein ARMSODRAFT_1023766 [Armillaria solidipes]
MLAPAKVHSDFMDAVHMKNHEILCTRHRIDTVHVPMSQLDSQAQGFECNILEILAVPFLNQNRQAYVMLYHTALTFQNPPQTLMTAVFWHDTPCSLIVWKGGTAGTHSHDIGVSMSFQPQELLQVLITISGDEPPGSVCSEFVDLSIHHLISSKQLHYNPHTLHITSNSQ